MKETALTILAIFLICISLPATLLAADVDVFAEAAYTDKDLEVRVYADINGPNLCSFGVKVAYNDNTLSIANPADAEKNEDVWFLGDAPYMDPDVSTPGEVVIIGGKLDPAEPLAGVGGMRVFLGKVRFARDAIGEAIAPDPETYFGIVLSLGRVAPYANFVSTDGTVMDNNGGGVSFALPLINQRGDANADGSITTADMIAVRNAFYNDAPVGNEPAADCNDDGSISTADMICIRNIFYGL